MNKYFHFSTFSQSFHFTIKWNFSWKANEVNMRKTSWLISLVLSVGVTNNAYSNLLHSLGGAMGGSFGAFFTKAGDVYTKLSNDKHVTDAVAKLNIGTAFNNLYNSTLDQASHGIAAATDPNIQRLNNNIQVLREFNTVLDELTAQLGATPGVNSDPCIKGLVEAIMSVKLRTGTIITALNALVGQRNAGVGNENEENNQTAAGHQLMTAVIADLQNPCVAQSAIGYAVASAQQPNLVVLAGRYSVSPTAQTSVATPSVVDAASVPGQATASTSAEDTHVQQNITAIRLEIDRIHQRFAQGIVAVGRDEWTHLSNLYTELQTLLDQLVQLEQELRLLDQHLANGFSHNPSTGIPLDQTRPDLLRTINQLLMQYQTLLTQNPTLV
jgi:hypothetical protein